MSKELAVDKQQNKSAVFQTVGPNQGKRPNKGNSKKQVKKTSAGGSGANSDALVAGPTTFMIQLTNVSPTINADDIARYIENKELDIKANDVKDHSTEGWSTKRFLLTFDHCHLDKVLSDDFWSQKIYYRRWFTPKAKAQFKSSSSN